MADSSIIMSVPGLSLFTPSVSLFVSLYNMHSATTNTCVLAQHFDSTSYVLSLVLSISHCDWVFVRSRRLLAVNPVLVRDSAG